MLEVSRERLLCGQTHLDFGVRLQTEPLGDGAIANDSESLLLLLSLGGTHRFWRDALARMRFVRKVF